jgi:hypothetical protein
LLHSDGFAQDHGGVTACIRLTKEAIELSSQKPTLSHMYSSQVLGLAHSHECLFQYGKAFAVIKVLIFIADFYLALLIVLTQQTYLSHHLLFH